MSSPVAAPASASASAAAAAEQPQDMTYEFDCPQYKDFNAPEDEHADAWFGPAEQEDETSNEEVFDGTAETSIPTSMEAEPEATTTTTITATAANAESKTVESEIQNEQPASSPKSRVQQLVQSFETKAVSEPVIQQTKPVLSRASSVVKEAVAAIEEAAAAAPIAPETATAIEIDEAPVAAAVAETVAEPAAVQEAEVAQEEQKEPVAEAEEIVDEATASRVSAVFGSLRSSLPLLSHGCQTLLFKSEQFKATDEEAAALTEEFETAVNSTPRVEQVAEAQPEEEESAVNESSESITLQLAAQFAEVADSPMTARTAAAAAAAAAPSSASTKRTPSASPSRRATDVAGASNVPSFLRPTAGSISRAQAIAEAAAAAQAAAGHITRRPVAVARAAAQVAASITPRLNKKRAASQDRLDELARPRSATRAASLKKESEAESQRPSTASKAAGSHRRASVAHHSSAAAAAAAKLTVAQSPALSTRARAKITHKPLVKSSEEAELQQIASEKEAVAATLRRNAAFFEKVASDPAVHMGKDAAALPLRSAGASVTQPEEFQFHTAKRAKITAHAHAAADAQVAAAAAASASKKDDSAAAPRMGEPTKVHPFSFQTAMRAPRRETILLSSEEQELLALKSIKPFKATPLPESILAAPAPMAVPSAKKSFQPTQATSPQLMTKERSKRKQEEETSAAPAAAVPVAAAAAPASQSAAKKPRREVQPFHLATEERGRRATEVFQSQREAEEAQERAAHNFHARAVGAAAAAAAPIVAPIVPHCVELHREARAKFESKIHETEAAARAAREFHARPNPFTGAALAHDETLLVPAIKSDRPLTVPVTPALKSKARHAKREEFEESMRAREAELKKMMELREQEEAERQAREMHQQRASMKPAVTVLKPRILEGPTFVPQPSTAKLTQPESPMLITKRRNQAHMRRMSTVPQDDEEAGDADAVDQENQVPEAFVQPAESAAIDADIAVKVASPMHVDPLLVSLLGDDSGLPLSAQFDAVAAE